MNTVSVLVRVHDGFYYRGPWTAFDAWTPHLSAARFYRTPGHAKSAVAQGPGRDSAVVKTYTLSELVAQ